MTARRGFGVAGAVPADSISALARRAEELGYATFWTNDTPSGDGLAGLAAAARVTTSIRLGVGVIPIDRKPGPVIAAQIEELGLPVDRLIVGIGSGGLTTGALNAVGEGIEQLHAAGGIRVAVGALGPRMVNLGAREADAVLLNWLTPAQATASAREIRALGSAEVIGYVRVALPEGEGRLREEAGRYASYPAYAAHFDRMGVTAFETCLCGAPSLLRSGFPAWEAPMDEVVVRAIAGEESTESYLRVLEAMAPGAA